MLNPDKFIKQSSHASVAAQLALSREAWRIFQIMSEFVDGVAQLSDIYPAVTVFGSARFDPKHRYFKLAEQIGLALSNAGFTVVTRGGPGTMEAANKGGYEGVSRSVGLNITLPHEQGANQYQDVSLSFKHFFARKVMFAKHACAYVVLPGGFGTMDELMEIATLMQTGKMPTLPIILVGSSFWQGLLDWFKQQMLHEENQTLSPQDLDLISLVDDAEQVLSIIFTHYEQRGFNRETESHNPFVHV